VTAATQNSHQQKLPSTPVQLVGVGAIAVCGTLGKVSAAAVEPLVRLQATPMIRPKSTRHHQLPVAVVLIHKATYHAKIHSIETFAQENRLHVSCSVPQPLLVCHVAARRSSTSWSQLVGDEFLFMLVPVPQVPVLHAVQGYRSRFRINIHSSSGKVRWMEQALQHNTQGHVASHCPLSGTRDTCHVTHRSTAVSVAPGRDSWSFVATKLHFSSLGTIGTS